MQKYGSYLIYFIFHFFTVYTIIFSILSISSSTLFEVCLVAFNPCLSGNNVSGRILRWINAIIGIYHSQTVSRWKCPLVGQFAGRIGREEPFKRQMLYELFFEKLYKIYQITKMVHYIDNCKWIFFSKSKNQLLG